MQCPDAHRLADSCCSGYRRLDGRFVPMEPDARGDLAIPELGLSLGRREGVMGNYRGPVLRWLDGDSVVSNADERAWAAQARAEAAEHRVAELEARLAQR